MDSQMDSVVMLLGTLLAGAAIVVGGTVYWRKRAKAQRLKKHFNSKTQAGRPTQ